MNVLSSVLIELLILSCLCFFFKQKTAYEMRISDWIQTCALPIFPVPFEGGKVVLYAEADLDREIDTDSANRSGLDCVGHGSASSGERSEVRRVGKACVSTCRYRWSTYTYKKKKRNRNVGNTNKDRNHIKI